MRDSRKYDLVIFYSLKEKHFKRIFNGVFGVKRVPAYKAYILLLKAVYSIPGKTKTDYSELLTQTRASYKKYFMELVSAGFIMITRAPTNSNLTALVMRDHYYITKAGKACLDRFDDVMHEIEEKIRIADLSRTYRKCKHRG